MRSKTPPFANRLPSPAVLVENTFAAAEKLLANQKDLSLKLIDVYLPAKASAPRDRTPKTA